MTVENDRTVERLARLEAECAADRRLVDERFRGRDHALSLQAKEVERRLEVLNHEAARIAQIQSKSVNAELYGANRGADQTMFTSIKEQLDMLKGRSQGATDLRAWLIAAFAVAVAVVGFTR